LVEEQEEKFKLYEIIRSNDGWISTLSLYPDDYHMIYDYEWPKTAADYARLFLMKSFELKEI
jgi:hypothetical protein